MALPLRPERSRRRGPREIPSGSETPSATRFPARPETPPAIRALPDGSGAADKLTVVFVLIGYRDPDAVKHTPALAINDVFAPFLGLYASMGAHETHLARVMKLTGQTTVVDPNP